MTAAMAIGCAATAGATAGYCVPHLARIATVHALRAENAIADELQEARGLYRGVAPLVGLMGSAALSVASIAMLGWTPRGIAIAALMFALLLLAIIDVATLLLPDIVTIPLALVGLAVNANSIVAPFPSALSGAILGFGSLFIVHRSIFATTNAEGMGLGDVKLVFAIGAWLGYQPLLHVLVVALLGAALYGLGLVALRRSGADRMIPFGPFLAFGAAFTSLVGTPLYMLATM